VNKSSSTSLKGSAQQKPRTDGLRWLLDERFQLAPGWQLVETGTPGARRSAPGAMVVRRRKPGREAMVLDAEFAGALSGIDRTGRLPPRIRRGRDGQRNRTIARLVLDGVLLLRTPMGTLTGPSALEYVCGTDQASRSAALPYRLTVRALRLGARFPVSTPALVASRLYRFHTLPRSRALESRFRDPGDVRAFLGLERWSISRRGFRREVSSHSEPYWEVWSKPNERRARYKLYVSPTLPALPNALEALLGVLDSREVVSLKVGTTLPGLLRPDRLVIHFAEHAHLIEAGRVLANTLADVPAHGVPLTAPFANSSLLSWGVDPESGGSVNARISWRMWLSQLLAFALFTARAHSTRGVAPEAFALARLSLEGVDPATLAPTDEFSILHGAESG
jgi:hypothetical protein